MKHLKIFRLAVLCGLIFTFIVGGVTYAYSERTQNRLAKEVIRLHVLANSDEPHDQALKLKVRDGVLAAFKDELSESGSIEETRQFIGSHINEIAKVSEDIIKVNGYGYSVSASLSRDFFPTKTYGDITFLPGEYEALRIVIGEGSGQNWWCVMFPPLCFVDVTKGKVPEKDKQELKKVTTEGEFKLLSDDTRKSDVTVNIRFKIVEWWQNIMRKKDIKKEKDTSYVSKDQENIKEQ
jgi:stage II sporulation protein R